MPDHDPTHPDESVSYVREMEVHHDAEDVKRIRFIGDNKSVEVGITDDVLTEFVETTEEVFHSIHADMADLKDIFNEAGDEDFDDDEYR